MKKLLAILVLGLGLILLSSCGMDYETFKKDSNMPYFSMACPASNPNAEDGCGLASHYTQEQANAAALSVCG